MFHFERQELLGYGALDGYVETDGRLTLLTSEIERGHILNVRPDGSLASSVPILTHLPQVAIGACRTPDGGWVVAHQASTTAISDMPSTHETIVSR